MENLTQEQREQIALEEFKKQPLQNICTIAIIKIAETAISTNAELATLGTKATVNGKTYSIKAIVSYEEINA